jgi:adenylate cyclase
MADGTATLSRRLIFLGGVCLPILLGLLCWRYHFADSLTRLSYDFPFVFRGSIGAPEVVMVYLDEHSAVALGQPIDQIWDRRLHTQLLDRLTADGAKWVFYDIVFAGDSPDPAVDDGFAAAIGRNGHTILGATLQISKQLGTAEEQIVMPQASLRRAAAGRGLLEFRPIDPDNGVRHIDTGSDQIASATWVLAEKLGAPVTKGSRQALDAWLNYFGPADTIESVSFSQALLPNGVSPGFFKNKVVMIGARPSTALIELGKDEFATPYTRWGGTLANRHFMTGLEVHATILENLLRGDWLERMPEPTEGWLLVVIGLASGIGLQLLRPHWAVFAALCGALAVTLSACAIVLEQRIWFAWMIPAAVEIPAAFAWSVGSQYFTESRRRVALRRAFAYYLSPHMADSIANSDFDLRPGGQLVDASILFTDLQGFTSLSEELADPRAISNVLIAYFNNTTRGILDSNGTIIKYIGDAVFAAWGTPVADPDHHAKAALAALQVHKASSIEVEGHKLVTRIGLNSGPVLSGNLGSDFRFDYTCIGDTTNFASRLEGLNKYFGTGILIGNTTCEKIADRFVTREIGRCLVVGKKEAVRIHELIGVKTANEPHPAWCEAFAAALSAIDARDFEGAREKLRTTMSLRGGADGPSHFYLQRMIDLEARGELSQWDGLIRFSEK